MDCEPIAAAPGLQGAVGVRLRPDGSYGGAGHLMIAALGRGVHELMQS